jgi:transposase
MRYALTDSEWNTIRPILPDEAVLKAGEEFRDRIVADRHTCLVPAPCA